MACSVNYAELFCQSNFSFLTGASHPEELVTQASFLRYSALAITDECSVAGVVRAHTVIREHNLKVKLIVGSLFRLNSECQIVLLSPDRKAYAELCRIITNARRRAEKGSYNLSEWDLMSLQSCLVIWLPAHKPTDAFWGDWLLKHHKHRLWIGIQRHLRDNDKEYLSHCEQLSHRLQIPITACGGVLMHHDSRLPLQHTLTAIRHHTTIDKTKSRLLSNAERSLRPTDKLAKIFKAEWLAESVQIAGRCTFSMDELQYEYPSELVPPDNTPMGYLRKLVNQGKQQRFPEGVPADIEKTINKELDLIESMNFPYFFLTIHDLVMFAEQQGILYQGRGSAANSVVCYCLKITSVDPRQISVLFERFISKERKEPPDIDVDFEHERREEIIQYIYRKYGRNRAALAATVICYRFKSAVRDVGKALGLEETQLEFFIKNISRYDRHQGWQTQLGQLGLDPESKKSQHFIQLVEEIQRFPRHLSQHVGGFVISSGPLHELVPVENATMPERTVIQWDKDDLESLGLLKVDVLALGMLSAIRKCFSLIEQHHQQKLTIADITRMQDDRHVYNMIQHADTIGVFQIESRAQMSMLPRLRPETYYDLVIQIAIVRPGPIQGDMVHPFLKRRQGLEKETYPSEAVREILSRTRGVPIFQEQVIKLAMVAAGFSGGEADQLRRAMAAWKKNGNVDKFKPRLVNGMLERGYTQEFAERLFAQICGFGEYGFPESHSASFAVLAYCSAWLKYHYPHAFYVALLNSQPMGFYSPSQLVQDARKHHITVLPACINHSINDHQLVRNNEQMAIRLGLRLIKGLSAKAVHKIEQQRPEQGFSHTTELKRLGLRQPDLQALASAGALNVLSGDRYAARWNLMDSLDELPLFKHASEHNEQGSFHYQISEAESVIEDYAATGLSLHKHPITLLDEAGMLKPFTRQKDLLSKPDKSLVTVSGVVTGRQSPMTASGVTFFTLEDDTGNISVVVWSGTAQAQKQAYLNARILEVKGTLEHDGQVTHVIAGKLTDLSGALSGLQAKSRDFH
ncbi:error-prone DNA polymerase [Vibrio albus]|uniref:Error-prone DNA polymerase n=1 Tax=Vibrio albus TaxID=2200953 RepID=A0A2U3BDV8_9VIBR|nr:error-prone DNA polymerase [Vibrio albus]PWI34986.1 error-prone DNA polymerase [Vibrio albus]